MQFGVIKDKTGQNGHWHTCEHSSSQIQLYQADGRQRVWNYVGERLADVSVLNRVAYSDGEALIWASISNGEQTQVHFISCNWNAQRYYNEIPKPFVPFIRDHCTFQ